MTQYPDSYPGAGQEATQPPQGYPQAPGQQYPQQGQQYPQGGQYPQDQQYPQAPGQPYNAPGQPYGQDGGQAYAQAPAQPYTPYGQTPGQQPYTPAPPVPAEYGYGQSPAAVVPQGMYQDQATGLVIPQGTQVASIGRRIGAAFLAVPLALVTLGIGYLIWGLIAWGNGQTPALQVLGMRCWRPEDRQIPGWGTMALREIIGRLAESILGLLTEIPAFVMFVTNKERKAWHDHIAGTIVLYDPDKVLTR